MAGVGLKGLKELDRALGRADKDLRKRLRKELKDIANVVAVGARAKAGSVNNRQSGDLVRGIKPYALTGKAGVRSGAMHRGYSYPSRLEYEGGGRGPGPRASLLPAFEEAKPQVMAETERLLDRLANDFHGGSA